MAEDDRKGTDDATDAPKPKKAAVIVDAEVTDEKDDEKSDENDEKLDALALAAPAPLEHVRSEDDQVEGVLLPAQMGHRRYIYAVFFAFFIVLSYFLSRMGVAAWQRLSHSWPKVGEPREDVVTPIAAAVSAVAIWFTYKRDDVQTLSDEVALELSKVEWPTREKVRRSTTIVVGASLGSSLAFWLYDIVSNRAVSFVTESKHPILFGLCAGLCIYLIRALGSRYLAGTER